MNDDAFASADRYNPARGITMDEVSSAISSLDSGIPKPSPQGMEVARDYSPFIPNGECRVLALDDLTDEEKFIIHEAFYWEAKQKSPLQTHLSVNLSQVSKRFHRRKENRGKKFETVYMMIRRRAYFLQNRGIATVKKGRDGLFWIHISREALVKMHGETRRRMEAARERNIDLIRSSCKIPTAPGEGAEGGSAGPQTTPGKRPKRDPLAIPRNATQERLSAIRVLKGIKMMNRVDRAEVSRLFERYNDRIEDKIIALMDNKTGELIGSEYSTRFNDLRKAAISLSKFDHAIEKSLQDYWRAALLTLTTDPKMYKDIWEANRSMSKAWNKFMSWLTKRNKGHRPEYIAAFEYTKSGLIHVHAIIFVREVAKKDDITEEWMRIGHGMVNDVCALVRKNVKGRVVWKWAKKRPERSTAANGGDYLKKYLMKTYLAKTDRYDNQSHVQSLYWAYNKRFWTSSRRLLPSADEMAAKQDAQPEQEESKEPAFSFFRILNADPNTLLFAEVGDYMVTLEGYDVLMRYKRDSRAARERKRGDTADPGGGDT